MVRFLIGQIMTYRSVSSSVAYAFSYQLSLEVNNNSYFPSHQPSTTPTHLPKTTPFPPIHKPILLFLYPYIGDLRFSYITIKTEGICHNIKSLLLKKYDTV